MKIGDYVALKDTSTRGLFGLSRNKGYIIAEIDGDWLKFIRKSGLYGWFFRIDFVKIGTSNIEKALWDIE